MKSINFLFCILLIIVSFKSSGQSTYCNVSESSIQDGLDSRRGSSVEYTENLTTGIALLLGLECDSALVYFKKAQIINQTPAVAKIVAQLSNKENKESENSKPTPPPITPPVIKDNPPTSTSKNDEEKNTIDDSAKSSSISNDNSISGTNSIDNSFSSEDLILFQKKGLLKVKKLTDYLAVIAQKSTPQTTGLATIESAIGLFDSENHYVQVASLKRPNERPKIPLRTYLNRLRMLNYQKVSIESASFTYSSTFRKGPDGNYYGVAKFRQVFKGYRDNKPVYSDVTTKTVGIVLKPYQKSIEGESVENWDVFLGDIDVVEIEELR